MLAVDAEGYTRLRTELDRFKSGVDVQMNVDGRRLAELMIEYGVGVQVQRTYRVVEIDEDFFT